MSKTNFMNPTPNPNGRTGRLGPHSIEAEEAVLGAVLINPATLHEVGEFLEPDDFFEVKHRWVFEAYLALAKQGLDIDYLTVCDHLKSVVDRNGDNHLDLAGGSSFITYLINNTPTHLNASSYAHLVEAASVRRRTLEAAGEIAQLARETNDNIEDIIIKAEAIFGAAVRRKKYRNILTVPGVISTTFDAYSDLQNNPDGAIKIPTGIASLDNFMMGLHRGDLGIVGARPGVGKTAFLLTIAHHLMKLKRNVLFVTLEMTPESLMHRIMAAETGINSMKFRTGRMTDEEFRRYTEASIRAQEWGGFIEYAPSLNIYQLRRRCAQIHREFGLDLVLVDYLQLMSGTGKENRTLEIGEITSGLKQMAGDLNVAVIAASQLSRALESRNDKRPTLPDLRESGNIEQDSAYVWALYRDVMYNPETANPLAAELIILKNRYGELGTLHLNYVAHLTQFLDAPRNGGRR